MAKINSRAKGAQGEREAAQFWSERGYSAIRGRQHSGAMDAPDIKFVSLKGIHCEVKRVQKLDLEAALTQSEMDAGDNIPIVMHRRNGDRWKITLDAKDFIDFFIDAFLGSPYIYQQNKIQKREAAENYVKQWRENYKITQQGIRTAQKEKAARKRAMLKLPKT